MFSLFFHVEITKVQFEIMKSWRNDGVIDDPTATMTCEKRLYRVSVGNCI